MPKGSRKGVRPPPVPLQDAGKPAPIADKPKDPYRIGREDEPKGQK
jgi:hypothetical protein